MITLQILRDGRLPRLGWLASFDPGQKSCVVRCGELCGVDPAPAPKWVAACVWAGPFSDGNFHLSPHVFGSGLRVTDGGIVFVPAATVTERIFCVRLNGRLLASNSLVLILSATGARLLPDADHAEWGESYGFGLDDYARQIPVEHPGLHYVGQVVFENLVVRESGEVVFTKKPAVDEALTDFASYEGALSRIVRALLDNASARPSGARIVSNASRGYDSPTVTAIVTEHARTECYTATRSNTRIPKAFARFIDADVIDDDGSSIAARLNAVPAFLESNMRAIPAAIETWLWAGAQLSPELIFWSMFKDAEKSSAATLWFSGYNGDGLWDVQLSGEALLGELKRTAPSGCTNAEARIRFGIIDCPLAFLFAREVGAVHRISTAAEMQPWRLFNDYDRPIPRRILESRGVPREAFGFGKKAVAQDYESPQGEELRSLFFVDSGWTQAAEQAYRGVNLGTYFARRALAIAEARGNRAALIKHNTEKMPLKRVGLDLRRDTFVWCVGRLCKVYAEIVQGPVRVAVRERDLVA
jgi:hypothetical protein